MDGYGDKTLKRKVDDDSENTPSPPGPTKRAKGIGHRLPSVNTEAVYNRFRYDHGLDCSRATFVGICAYLYHLIRWRYSIPASAFDEFICSHSSFVHDPHVTGTNQECVPANHTWFAANKAHYTRPGTVLDGGLLYDIGLENPYTFALTEASMELIANKGVRWDGGCL